MTRDARQRAVLSIIVQGPVQLIGSRLRHDVHEAARGTPKLGVCARRGHDDFLHRVKIECKRRPLPTALLSEERIVEVSPVHHHVVVDALLSTDRQLVAVRTLYNRHMRREQRQVQVVAAVVRKTRDGRFREASRALDLGRLDDRLGRLDHNGLQLHRGERQVEIHRLTKAQPHAGAPRFAEPDGPGADIVGAQRHQGGDENTAFVGHDLALEASLRFMQDDRGPGDGGPRRVGDRAANDAGGCLRLRRQHNGERESQYHRPEELAHHASASERGGEFLGAARVPLGWTDGKKGNEDGGYDDGKGR